MVDSPAIQNFLVSQVTRYLLQTPVEPKWVEVAEDAGCGLSLRPVEAQEVSWEQLGLCVLPHRWPLLTALPA